MSRRTKIVATVGPASQGLLDELIEAGVDVFRLNLSHGHIDDHLERVAAIRAAAARTGRHIGVLADLPGPKIRAGQFPDGGILLESGSTLELIAGEEPSVLGRVSVDYPTLVADARIGDRVILGDGAISLRIEVVGPDSLTAIVLTGGLAQGRPGVHLPAERMRLTAPTMEDLALVDVMTKADVDFIAVSFVRTAADVEQVQAAIASASGDGRRPMVVAKIETLPAITNIFEIIGTADAIMVARGDLGIESALEDVPHLQKQVIRACVTAGVPVITATQMLESMIQAPSPTRAEVSDVANAVFDGSDALMLSGETAIGADPVLVVETMARVAERAERNADYRQWGGRVGRLQRNPTDNLASEITTAMTHAAWQAVGEVNAVAILCCTRSGRTARETARFRPLCRIIGLSPSVRTLRQLSLSWGVYPIAVNTYATTDELVWYAIEATVSSGVVANGSVVAVLAGAPDTATGATDVLRLVRLA